MLLTRPIDLQHVIARTQNIEKYHQLKQAQPQADQKQFNRQLEKIVQEKVKKTSENEESQEAVIHDKKEEGKRKEKKKKKRHSKQNKSKDRLYDNREHLHPMDEEDGKGGTVDLSV
jgi:hypothetical protein